MFIVSGVVIALALSAAAVFWVYFAQDAVAGEGSNEHRFTGITDEIVMGDLQGDTSVTGTLKFPGSHPIQAGADGVVTALPQPGSVLTLGARLYAVNDVPSFLLRGALPAWRAFTSGMDDGPDVAQLEQSLSDLGHFAEAPDDSFGWATTRAIKNWQKANGQPETGELPFGAVVFSDGDLRVGEIISGVGTRVGPGAELYDSTKTTQVVESNIKLADQQVAALDTPVTVRLPGGEVASGKVTSVGTPTEVDTATGQRQTVIPIVVSLDDPAQAAGFQQASVTVVIPTDTREGVLSVPIGALFAITPEQFGVEVVHDDGTTTTVAVATGLFAGGRVEISGDDIEAGQRVVVPQR